MSIELIGHLEELAARAWPAAVIEPLDGWLLRWANGLTRRANSVWPNATSQGRPLAEKLDAVERFYAQHSLPPRYQISPACQPPDLDAILARRGYVRVMPTQVQVASLATVLDRGRPEGALTVALTEELEEAWLDTYCAADAWRERAGVAGILQRITACTGFAQALQDGQSIAVGLGVVEGDWVGVFCMATRPEFRRRGAAGAVLKALASWAQKAGAGGMYLQVREENAAALALYRQAGLERLYGYHYREAPAPA